MHLQDHAVEAKFKPVQELKRSDASRLWEVAGVFRLHKKDGSI